jgi:hypothetical protein
MQSLDLVRCLTYVLPETLGELVHSPHLGLLRVRETSLHMAGVGVHRRSFAAAAGGS